MSSVYQDVFGAAIIIAIFLVLYAQREQKSIVDVVKDIVERFK